MTPTALPFTLPDPLKPLACEIATYFRELPRLIADGEDGRVALIKGDDIVSVWDTRHDALQAGFERFGQAGFAAQPIKFADLELWQAHQPAGEPSCQS